jgi:hypothetical protein
MAKKQESRSDGKESTTKVSEANRRAVNQLPDDEWDEYQAKMREVDSYESPSDKVQRLEELVRIKRLQDELDGVPNAQNAAASENGVIIGFLIAIVFMLWLLLQ